MDTSRPPLPDDEHVAADQPLPDPRLEQTDNSAEGDEVLPQGADWRPADATEVAP